MHVMWSFIAFIYNQPVISKGILWPNQTHFHKPYFLCFSNILLPFLHIIYIFTRICHEQSPYVVKICYISIFNLIVYTQLSKLLYYIESMSSFFVFPKTKFFDQVTGFDVRSELKNPVDIDDLPSLIVAI